MICKFCGAELLGNSTFCVKCGKNNNEEIVDDVSSKNAEKTLDEGVTQKKKSSLGLKAVLIPVLVVLVIATIAIIMAAIPVSLKASHEAGTYEECISVSFSASKLLPVGKEVEIYLLKDDNGYLPYDGEEFYLNQDKTYSFCLYTVNGAGIKSSEKKYEYIMNVPKPADLQVSVQPGTYDDYQDVSISSSDGSTIYYTIDGTDPTEESEKYNEIIHLENGTTIIKAFAINDAGTTGKIWEWKYELDLPIPATVSYSLNDGIYYEPLNVELASDTDAIIYYTLDGSKPTTSSEKYSGAISLQSGIHKIKALAINSYNIPSEITEANYAITYQKYGKFQRTAVADGYYGIVGSNNTFVKYDSQMNEEKTYDIHNVFSIYSDGKNIYYLADNSIYKLKTGCEAGEKLVDVTADNIAIADNTLFFVSSQILYSVDLDGNNLKRYDSFSSCSIVGCFNNELYLISNGVLYKITNSDTEPEMVCETDSSACYLHGETLYYIDGGLNMVCRNINDGSSKVIGQTESEYYNLDSDDKLFNTTKQSKTVTTNYTNIFVCHKTLYYLARITTEYDVYHIISQRTDQDITTFYKWYALNLENGNTWDTNIASSVSSAITVFDNVIIDGDGNRTEVIQ